MVVKSTRSSEVLIVDVLPSKFLPYDINKLEVRSFTLGELKYLGSGDLSDESLVEVFKNCIINYDIYKLSWSDFLFLATHISLFTIPSQKWTLRNLYCHNEECGKLIDKTLTKETFLEFEDLGFSDYPINAKINGYDLEFGVLTVQSHLNFIKNPPKLSDHLISIYSLAGMVINKSIEEAFKILESTNDPIEIEMLTKIDKLLYHDVKPIKLTCDNCKKEYEYTVGLEVSTLSPFRENEKSIDSRITFGKKSK